MAVPKRRHSRSRKRKKMAGKKVKVPGHSLCSRCGEVKVPHRVCAECGFYGDKEIIKKEE